MQSRFITKKNNTPFQPKRVFRGGFTLIETFIAISILMVAVIGPLTLAQRSLSSASLTKDKMTAYFLAQDAIEYIRKIRDEKNLGGSPSGFAGFISSVSACSSSCIIDTFTGSAPSDCGGTCQNLRYDTVSFLYGYTNGDASPFKRSITIIPSAGSPTYEAVITIRVVWVSQGFGQQEVVLRDTFLDG